MSEDPNEPKHKMVNGELVELTKEEIAQIKKERAEAEAAQPSLRERVHDRLDDAQEKRDDRRDDRRMDRREDRQEKRDAKR